MTSLFGTAIFIPKIVSILMIALNLKVNIIAFYYEVHCVQIGQVMQCYGYRVEPNDDEDD